MTTLYLAWTESRHFTFEGVGRTRQEALTRLQHALERHAEQYQLAPDWVPEMLASEPLMRVLTPGGYRDRDRLD
jgi:hypothetical protein